MAGEEKEKDVEDVRDMEKDTENLLSPNFHVSATSGELCPTVSHCHRVPDTQQHRQPDSITGDWQKFKRLSQCHGS